MLEFSQHPLGHPILTLSPRLGPQIVGAWPSFPAGGPLLAMVVRNGPGFADVRANSREAVSLLRSLAVQLRTPAIGEIGMELIFLEKKCLQKATIFSLKKASFERFWDLSCPTPLLNDSLGQAS